MKTLTATEKRYLESILDMKGDSVWNFTNATFTEIFRLLGVDIDHDKYRIYEDSIAKRLRAFWQIEPDEIVAEVLIDLLPAYETKYEI